MINIMTIDEAVKNLSKVIAEDVIAIIDLEATCTDDPSLNGIFVNEIIEIGLIVWDKKENNFDEYQIYVKPTTSEITEFCTKLTGITDEIVQKDGLSFERAMIQLDHILKTYPGLKTWISYGDYDRNQISCQCCCEIVENPMKIYNHINIKKVAATFSGKKNKFGLGDILKHYGLEFIGNQHCGVDDAYNIALLTSKLVDMRENLL